jgi:hypothetical protein
VDLLVDFDSREAPVQLPLDVTWTGLIQIDEPTTAALELVSDVPNEVLLDGELQDPTAPAALFAGWHTVEISMRIEQPTAEIGLQWVDETGQASFVLAKDTFPLGALDGWGHTRAMGLPNDPQAIVTQRFDFSPHLAIQSVLQLSASIEGLFVTEERWEGVFDLEEPGSFTLRSEFRAGTVTMFIDGEPLATRDAGPQLTTTLETSVRLDAGHHTIELVQELTRQTTWSGATLEITDSDGDAPIIRPY